jgi:hypothetical protein
MPKTIYVYAGIALVAMAACFIAACNNEKSPTQFATTPSTSKVESTPAGMNSVATFTFTENDVFVFATDILQQWMTHDSATHLISALLTDTPWDPAMIEWHPNVVRVDLNSLRDSRLMMVWFSTMHPATRDLEVDVRYAYINALLMAMGEMPMVRNTGI